MNFNNTTASLHLQRVAMVDGDYGPDGTYWGGGRGTLPLWCAFNGRTPTHQPAHGSRLYVRAINRVEARLALQAGNAGITFKKD
jgi:hypothetical protein